MATIPKNLARLIGSVHAYSHADGSVTVIPQWSEEGEAARVELDATPIGVMERSRLAKCVEEIINRELRKSRLRPPIAAASPTVRATPPLPTKEQLARLRELHEKATPGPWRYFDGGNPLRDSGLSEIDGPGIEDGVCFMMADGRHGEIKMKLNADLIVASHQALPPLLAGCERALELEEAEWRIIDGVTATCEAHRAKQTRLRVAAEAELDALRARHARLVEAARKVLTEPASCRLNATDDLLALLAEETP